MLAGLPKKIEYIENRKRCAAKEISDYITVHQCPYYLTRQCQDREMVFPNKHKSDGSRNIGLTFWLHSSLLGCDPSTLLHSLLGIDVIGIEHVPPHRLYRLHQRLSYTNAMS